MNAMIFLKMGLRTTPEKALMVPSTPPFPGHESSTSAVGDNVVEGGYVWEENISLRVVSCHAPPSVPKRKVRTVSIIFLGSHH